MSDQDAPVTFTVSSLADGGPICAHGVSLNRICWTCYVKANQLPHLSYWQWVDETASVMGSDGCTMAGPWFGRCCDLHDIHGRAGVRRDGTLITDKENDDDFRSCIRRDSKFGWWSPMAWWRGVMVKWFGKSTAPNQRMSLMADPVAQRVAQRRAQILREEGKLI